MRAGKGRHRAGQNIAEKGERKGSNRAERVPAEVKETARGTGKRRTDTGG